MEDEQASERDSKRERERDRELEGRNMLSGPLSPVNLQWVSFIFILLD